MKSIHTLIPDIYSLVSKKYENKEQGIVDGVIAKLSTDISRKLVEVFSTNKARATLRLSQMGDKCPRALWYSIHHPELAEPLPPWAEIKYAFGHVLEAYLVTLSKEAGHEVTGEQDVISVDGIQGHRDCVIDGCVVDVKSASSRSFLKFKTGSLATDDPFGYLSQLDGYVVGSQDDPLVTVKDKGYLLAINKELGHLALYEHNIRELHIRERIRNYKAIVALDRPPQCTCEQISDGNGGNLTLGVNASYSPFKFECFPGLRTFLYANGPRYLTKVVKQPRNKDGPITEVDKHGTVIYR